MESGNVPCESNKDESNKDYGIVSKKVKLENKEPLKTQVKTVEKNKNKIRDNLLNQHNIEEVTLNIKPEFSAEEDIVSISQSEDYSFNLEDKSPEYILKEYLNKGFEKTNKADAQPTNKSNPNEKVLCIVQNITDILAKDQNDSISAFANYLKSELRRVDENKLFVLQYKILDLVRENIAK